MERWPIPSKGFSDVVSCGHADGIMVVPNGVQSVELGTKVVFHPWSVWLP
ncbi:hypothetical protein K8I31_21010 [bacterium]|nr:hypothetical protein [bacterium]